MDLSHVPDLVQQFAFVVHFVPEIVHQAAEQTQNLAAAFTDAQAFGPAEKLYHAGKLIVVGGLFGASVVTGNVEGILASGIAEIDELNALCREGAAVRHEKPKGPTSTPV
jgi:hypothetical protein